MISTLAQPTTPQPSINLGTPPQVTAAVPPPQTKKGSTPKGTPQKPPPHPPQVLAAVSPPHPPPPRPTQGKAQAPEQPQEQNPTHPQDQHHSPTHPPAKPADEDSAGTRAAHQRPPKPHQRPDAQGNTQPPGAPQTPRPHPGQAKHGTNGQGSRPHPPTSSPTHQPTSHPYQSQRNPRRVLARPIPPQSLPPRSRHSHPHTPQRGHTPVYRRQQPLRRSFVQWGAPALPFPSGAPQALFLAFGLARGSVLLPGRSIHGVPLFWRGWVPVPLAGCSSGGVLWSLCPWFPRLSGRLVLVVRSLVFRWCPLLLRPPVPRSSLSSPASCRPVLLRLALLGGWAFPSLCAVGLVVLLGRSPVGLRPRSLALPPSLSPSFPVAGSVLWWRWSLGRWVRPLRRLPLLPLPLPPCWPLGGGGRRRLLLLRPRPRKRTCAACGGRLFGGRPCLGGAPLFLFEAASGGAAGEATGEATSEATGQIKKPASILFPRKQSRGY